MKFSMAAISLFLLFFITSTLESMAESSSQGPYRPAECCFRYIDKAIPRHRIADYYETSSECAKPGVVFITKKSQSICANPSDAWVQDYIKGLKEK